MLVFNRLLFWLLYCPSVRLEKDDFLNGHCAKHNIHQLPLNANYNIKGHTRTTCASLVENIGVEPTTFPLRCGTPKCLLLLTTQYTCGSFFFLFAFPADRPRLLC